jgi:hypothetical protein
MIFYEDGFYVGSDLDKILDQMIEVIDCENVSKISELSRQIRTFFNFKAGVMRIRFQSASNPTKNGRNTVFYTRKQEFESLSQVFIKELRESSIDGQTLEEGIEALYLMGDKSRKLLLLSEKVFTQIHQFSEVDVYDHPKFFKFMVTLVRYASMVKKCLNMQFTNFYEELELNYANLEKELEDLFGEVSHVKNKNSIKKREERLRS